MTSSGAGHDLEPRICFVHDRANWYLEYALRQAARSSGKAEVVLIGPPALGGSAWQVADIDKYKAGARARDFLAVYRHMSPNPYEFESFCFLRWFYLFDYMSEAGIERAFYLDSDVLLVTTLEELVAWVGDGAMAGFHVPEQSTESLAWIGSGHCSYWTKSMLERFCEFILRSYREENYLDLYLKKWKSPVGGGISDMATLYLFWLENRDEIRNFAERRDSRVIDLNFNGGSNYLTDEYSERFRHKRVARENGKPFFIPMDGGPRTGALAIHFQGIGKLHMPRYYSGPGFPGKVGRDFGAALTRSLHFLVRANEKLLNAFRARIAAFLRS